MTIRKVIIVDDEQLIRETLPSMMDWESLGFEVVGLFEDGEDAWQFLQTHGQIDLVITDIQMDVCTGLELLKRIRSMNLHTRVIMISGYDEFQYLRSAMMLGIDNYLLKPINEDELRSSLQQVQEHFLIEYQKSQEMNEGIKLMKNNILNQIITDNYSIRDVREKCRMLGIDLDEGGFQVVVMDTIVRQNAVPLLEEKYLGQFAIINMTQEILSSDKKINVFGHQNGQIVVIFSRIQSESKEAIRLRMEEVCSLIERILKIKLVVLIGKPYTSWREISQSFLSAMELHDYRYFVDQSIIMDYGQKDVGTKKETLSKQLGMNQLHDLLDNEEYEHAEKILHRIGILIQEIVVRDLLLMRSVFIDFTLVCMSKLRQLEFEILEHNHTFPKVIDTLFETDTNEELLSRFMGIATYLLQTMQQLKVNRSTTIVERVIEFIDSHYMENVSIQYLSQNFHISAPYLGKRLKIELGKTFNDYLNFVRINKAKNLLLLSDVSTKEIAEKVGYAEPNYFYSQFKKITGKSPTEFRRG
ncbi:response regulator [Paenibacillus germinis]|nr:response regulator [Paenibacillus germinis]